MDNTEKQYWDTFYNEKPNLNECSNFCKYITTKYISKINDKDLTIGDFGCGNCRDSTFFAENGYNVLAVDSSIGIVNPHKNIKLLIGDIEEILENNDNPLLNIVYMRWFLHALPYVKGKIIFNKSVECLKKDGFLCIEVRSLNDIELKKKSIYNENDESYYTNHKRWLYTKEKILSLINTENLEILELSEDFGYSKNDHSETYISNPLLIRLIARRK